MIELEDALAAYAQALHRLPVETVAVTAAARRVLAEPVVACTDLPRLDQSAMDGYALRAADVAQASSASPVRLPVVQEIAAGAHESPAKLEAASAARIFTGAPIPRGADTVILQERVTREGDALVFESAYPARRNIRWRGEELKIGAPVAEAGQRVTPGLLASLVNAGLTELSVFRRPRVRVLVTGDEVRPAGSLLARGQIPDSNGPLVRAVLDQWGYEVPAPEHVADTAEAVREALTRALADADLVLSCGGASVGDRDFVVAVAGGIGLRQVFWKVAQKPGKPMYFGLRSEGARQAALLALPGNPGAVLIGMIVHARRILEVMEGATDPAPHWSSGVLSEAVESDSRRARLLRMRLTHGDDGVARLAPLPNQDSHMLSNLSAADVLVWLPAAPTAAEAGTVRSWVALPM